ncbi:MAG: DUF2974 domain-containing protein [Eubacteriales bacterium]|nr:DUF2974 domain-containing protein [Eubacteriales bacterium]
MGNMLDYIQWRGDLSFAQSPFNEVDNLILSSLSYLNLDGMEEVYGRNALALPELAEAFFARHSEEELSADKSFVSPVPYMMRDMAKTARFKGCAIRNYVNEILTKEEQQFSAMEILLEDGSIYVAFRGTDDTIVGWKEDFNLCNGVVPAQQRAVEYLEQAGRNTSRMLRVGGHSKGGNLAVFAAAECSREVREQILEIYSNDGPGFPRELLEQEKFRKILPITKRIIPEFSVIGMLLSHEKEPLIVQSSQKGILQHDAFSWEVSGPSFVMADGLNKKAASFNASLHKWIDDMDAEQRSRLITDLFSVIEACGTEYISQVQEGGLKSFRSMLKKIENFPPESGIMMQELVNALFAGWLERLHQETQERISFLNTAKE